MTVKDGNHIYSANIYLKQTTLDSWHDGYGTISCQSKPCEGHMESVNWWSMIDGPCFSCILMESGIQNSAQPSPVFLFAVRKTQKKPLRTNWEDKFLNPFHPYKWVVQNARIFLKRILGPQKVCLCQGRQPLEVGTVCQAEWIWGKWCLKGWR